MKLSEKKRERAFEGTIPMYCPDCDMTYYRKKELKHDSCSFCSGRNIQITTHEHVIQLVEATLLLDQGHFEMTRDVVAQSNS